MPSGRDQIYDLKLTIALVAVVVALILVAIGGAASILLTDYPIFIITVETIIPALISILSFAVYSLFRRD